MDTKRFQTSKYRQQINAARNYQRHARPRPTTPVQKFLHFIGLGSTFNRVIAVLVLAAFVYLTYFANFLFLRDPHIQGADAQATAEVLDAFHSYAHTYRKLLPQKNILYFSKTGFSEYLLSSNHKIAAVQGINKKLPNTLNIRLNQRVPVYAVQAQNQWFILNSDGRISNKTDESGASGYQKIFDTADEAVAEGDMFIPEQAFNFLQFTKDNFESRISVAIDHYEIPGRGSDDLVVYTKKGFKVTFTTSTVPNDYLDRFAKLWSAMTPDQQNALVYADMRFDLNAYACFRGAACAR